MNTGFLEVGHGTTHDVKGRPADCAPHLTIAVAITTGNEQDFPVRQFVEILISVDAYLTHEELVTLVGGNQFFGLSLSSSWFSSV